MPHRKPALVLTLSFADKPGIVAAIASVLAEHNCNITDSAQFGDMKSGRFFMRVSFSAPHGLGREEAQAMLFEPVIEQLEHDIGSASNSSSTCACSIMVSRLGHCLNDLLYRQSWARSPIEIAAIVSNHPISIALAASARNSVPLFAGDAAKPRRSRRSALLELIEDAASTSSCWPATCRCCPNDSAPSSPGTSSTSTTRSCPASRAPSPITRRTRAA